MGTHEGVTQFTRDDLLKHRATLYAPANMLLSCATNLDIDDAFALLEDSFGRIPVGVPPTQIAVTTPIKPTGTQTAHEPMDKEQITILLGSLLPGASEPDVPAIMVANRILSARLALELRERQGLAYSVGSSVRFDRNFGWQMCSMGTGKENYTQARDGILAEVHRISSEPVSAEELETAKNTLWGSSLMRRLSRVNQAYYMVVNEFLGLGYDYDDHMAEQMRAVTIEDVQRVAQMYFDTGDYILATVGDLE
jgi:predicted Zn-dependent peptidase